MLMLNLASETDPRWVERVIADVDLLLVDHANCEKKAASTAVSLLFRYPGREELLRPLARLAREELAHYEQVLDAIATRGATARQVPPSPYAGELLAVVREREPARLIDTLLCLALIEARSCERMKLLADSLGDPALAALYRGLLASEARHHQAYLDLALAVAPANEVRSRLRELALHEAAVIAAAPPLALMHT
ncbi:MAG: tRNA-(ms[2]io[6]A)-hydroxylase [Deltaproteobacteria bacterium]